jgi:hypothetical protein
MTLPLTIITMKSHLSLRRSLFVEFGLFGWLGCFWRGNTSGIWQGVKLVPAMVRFWTPQLFLRWNLIGSTSTPSLTIGLVDFGGVSMTSLGRLMVALNVLGHYTHQPYQNK